MLFRVINEPWKMGSQEALDTAWHADLFTVILICSPRGKLE